MRACITALLFTAADEPRQGIERTELPLSGGGDWRSRDRGSKYKWQQLELEFLLFESVETGYKLCFLHTLFMVPRLGFNIFCFCQRDQRPNSSFGSTDLAVKLILT